MTGFFFFSYSRYFTTSQCTYFHKEKFKISLSFCFYTVSQDIQELIRLRQQEHTSWQEELLDSISAVLLGTEENVSQEDELLKALEDKYDALRDKLLLEALEKQYGTAEWARLSEQERQARLAKLKLQERRLRQQGRFDDAAALLGEGLKNAEALQVIKLEQFFDITIRFQFFFIDPPW